jgi:hypothetical protein
MNKMQKNKPLVEHMVLRCSILIESGHAACASDINETSAFE